MARGKYSPTVNAAYAADQNWFKKFCNLAPHGDQVYSPFDPEGFDSYGYNKDDEDRAGNNEYLYLSNDGGDDNDYNNAYEAACDAWGFDGTKPALRN